MRRPAVKKLSHKDAQIEIHDEELSVEEAKEHAEELIAVVDNKSKLIDALKGSKHTLEELEKVKTVAGITDRQPSDA